MVQKSQCEMPYEYATTWREKDEVRRRLSYEDREEHLGHLIDN